ncbi:phosphate transporter 1;4 [Actinidia rufa]|uniref:Phosphate transporter 14 n=1 Tax=Actinidia rufa TaxID=165716 RepID=A0A7J0GUP2_9ERIC|nr:phosphate transporter 1;4 [Actinidia rufa]
MNFNRAWAWLLDLNSSKWAWTHPDGLDSTSLTFFFANFGPKATTFVVPAEIFSARLRSTCHGISAAAGKARAIVGAYGFLYATQPTDKTKTDAGYPRQLKGKSLEEISGENKDEAGDAPANQTVPV